MKFVIATFSVDPAHQPAVIAALKRCQVETLREPGCLEFDVLASQTDPEKLVVVEAFRTPRDHETHMQTSYVRDVVETLSTLAKERTYQNIITDAVSVDHG